MSVLDGPQSFDICLDYGKDGEHYVDSLLAHLWGCESCEVKTDRRCLETGNIFIEYEAWSNRTARYEPSGIATSTAHLWAFVLSDTGVVFIFPTEKLRWLARMAWRDEGRRREQGLPPNPTRGVVISLAQLVQKSGEMSWE